MSVTILATYVYFEEDYNVYTEVGQKLSDRNIIYIFAVTYIKKPNL